jgi:hypothetical protein
MTHLNRLEALPNRVHRNHLSPRIWTKWIPVEWIQVGWIRVIQIIRMIQIPKALRQPDSQMCPPLKFRLLQLPSKKSSQIMDPSPVVRGSLLSGYGFSEDQRLVVRFGEKQAKHEWVNQHTLRCVFPPSKLVGHVLVALHRESRSDIIPNEDGVFYEYEDIHTTLSVLLWLTYFRVCY